MKKMCVIFAIGVFLALMVSSVSVAQELSTRAKFSLSIGGLLASISQGYNFDFDFDSRGETGFWTESVANIGSKFGFDIGVGIYPIPLVEIYASYNTYGGNAPGDYSLTIPHFSLLGEVVSDSIGDVESEFKASVINFGLAFHPAVRGKIKPYFGAGLSSVNVKVDLLDSVSLEDFLDVAIYYYAYSWDYWWTVEEFGEAIDITKVRFTEESETVWGFHARAGLNIEVGRNICIFAEARYLSATAKFDRPEITFKTKTTLDYYQYEYWYGNEYEYEYTEIFTTEEEIDIDDEIEIKVGGVQGIVGIKFIF